MSDSRRAGGASPWAVGFAVFASTLMIVLGIFHAIQGLVALLDDNFYVSLPNYTFEYDLTGWGWTHLILGALIALAGFALLGGALWARAVGIALAGLSAIANFLWLPYYPVWSVVAIALAVAVIWGLAAYQTS
ncbi:MAG TPA: hypothetical protein VKG85_11200 [Actinomycetes bacterium]|nr:hypothetical protein [Actinomycetes bacterium]